MYRLAHLFFFTGAVVAGHQYIGAHRKADEHIDDQVDQSAGGAHGGQGLAAGEAAHHHNVCCVKEKLQDAGEHQWEGEDQDFAQKRAAAHIHFIAAFCHNRSPFFGASRGKSSGARTVKIL